jgi:hypothetical protein
MAELNDQHRLWAKIVAKAWADEDYKQRLLNDPAAVLKAEGVEVPKGVEFKCVEATENLAGLVLPPKPTAIGGVEEGERLAAVYICSCSSCCH